MINALLECGEASTDKALWSLESSRGATNKGDQGRGNSFLKPLCSAHWLFPIAFSVMPVSGIEAGMGFPAI